MWYNLVDARRVKQYPCFFRTKPAGSYRYLQIVHSVREGKRVRQQVIGTLGRLKLLEASGQLKRLMRSGLRHCQTFAVIDAHAVGEIHPVAIRRIEADENSDRRCTAQSQGGLGAKASPCRLSQWRRAP
jgi:hypothetical protein